MAKITTSELEEMIRRRIAERGLAEGEIGEELITAIKEKIKEASNIRGIKQEQPEPEEEEEEEEEEDVVVDVSPETPTETPGELPEPVISTVEGDPKAEELAGREGEVEEKERSLAQREGDIEEKEFQLKGKEEELAYKPKLPKFMDEIGPEKVFIFNTDEVSLGGESLSKAPFRLVLDPDSKKTMNDLWLEKGKKNAEVYLINFEKLGDIEFDPFQGTSKFEEKRFEIPEEESTEEVQEAPEQMEDAIEPVTDVTQPMSDDMGLQTVDMEGTMKKKIDDILRDYLQNNKE